MTIYFNWFGLSGKTRPQEHSGLSREKACLFLPQRTLFDCHTRLGSMKMKEHVWVETDASKPSVRHRAFHSKEIHLRSKPLQVWEALLQTVPWELQMNPAIMHAFERLREKMPCWFSALTLVDDDRLVTICKAVMLSWPTSMVFFLKTCISYCFMRSPDTEIPGIMKSSEQFCLLTFNALSLCSSTVLKISCSDSHCH